MCRHAVRQLEFAHAIERVLESMRSLQQCDELLPTQFKPLATVGVLLSPTSGAPGRCRLSQRIFSTASQLQALQWHARPASLRRTPSVQRMGGIKVGQTAASNVHLFILAQGSQTANPLSECLLSQRAQAEPTQVLGPNYRKEGKPELATDWASWVNVNATTEGYFILWHGCNRDRKSGRFGMEQTKALRLLKNTYKLWHVLLFLRYCETLYAGMIRAHMLNARLLQCCSQRGSGNVPNLIQTRHNRSHSSVLLCWCCVNTFLDFDYPRVILSVVNVYIPSFIVFTQVLIGDLG